MVVLALLLSLSTNLFAQDGQLQLTAPTECDNVICNGEEGVALSTLRQRMGISFEVPSTGSSNAAVSDDDVFSLQSGSALPSLGDSSEASTAIAPTNDGPDIGNTRPKLRSGAINNSIETSMETPSAATKKTSMARGSTSSASGGGFNGGTTASSNEAQAQAATTDGGQDSSSQSQQSYGGWGQFSGSRSSSATTGGARVANGYVYSDANPSSTNRGGTVSGLTASPSGSSDSSGSTTVTPQASQTQASSLDRYSNVSATSLNKKMNNGAKASTASRVSSQAQMASTAGMGGSSQFSSGAAKPAKASGQDSGGGLGEALSKVASALGLNRFWGGLSSSSSSRGRSGLSLQVGSRGRNQARGSKDGSQQKTALLDRHALQRAYAQARGTASLELTSRQGSIFHQMCEHYNNYATANRIPNDRGDCPQ